MCITLHPSELTGTKLYAGEAERDGKYVHVLAYQNKATSLTTEPNAMVLPIPAKSLGQENAIDTRNFKSFLGDIIEATQEPSLSRGLRSDSRSFSAKALVFDVGSYTVVLSKDPSAIIAALENVPANKRPKLNIDVISSFSENYPGWPIAVCCWKGSIDPEPLLWWFEPLDPSVLFAPALDGHDGKAPQPTHVKVDHYVCFGSTLAPRGTATVRYSEADEIPEEVKAILPTRAIGRRFKGSIVNGDFMYPVSLLHRPMSREKPPGVGLRLFPGPENVPHPFEIPFAAPHED